MIEQPFQSWDSHTKKLVSATVGKGLDAAALAQLEHISISRGLDPLNNELYAIPKGGRCTFITSINGMLKVAATQLDGVDTVFYDENANMFDVWLPSAPPAACGVTVYRKGCSRGFTATVRFDDYKGGNLWQKMPSTMIKKVALASALRLSFSDLLAGLYASEEMDQAGFSRPEPVAEAPAPAPPAEKPRKKMAPAEPIHEVIDRPTDDLHHGGVTEVQKKIPARAVAVMEKPVEEGLPVRADLTGAISKLYEVARIKGLTVKGWATLGLQMGGLTPGAAAKFLTPMSSISEEKVANLNAGKSTTGEALG